MGDGSWVELAVYGDGGAMNVDQEREYQRQIQQRQIDQKAPNQYRIGDRDPDQGTYQLIYPDDSVDPRGLKLYAAESAPGDPVLAQQRADGFWALSEANPGPVQPYTPPWNKPVVKGGGDLEWHWFDDSLRTGLPVSVALDGVSASSPFALATKPTSTVRFSCEWVGGVTPIGYLYSIVKNKSFKPLTISTSIIARCTADLNIYSTGGYRWKGEYWDSRDFNIENYLNWQRDPDFDNILDSAIYTPAFAGPGEKTITAGSAVAVLGIDDVLEFSFEFKPRPGQSLYLELELS
jgi:hypothetical protein